MRQKEGFVLREVSGRAVLMSSGKTDNKRMMSELSETAAWLWQEAARQGEFTVDTLTEALLNEFDAEPAEVRADVEELVALWKQEGLVR